MKAYQLVKNRDGHKVIEVQLVKSEKRGRDKWSYPKPPKGFTHVSGSKDRAILDGLLAKWGE